MARSVRNSRQLAEGRQLARALRAARQQSNAPQSSIATRSGISLDMLRKMELEQVLSPSFFTVARLARELDLTLDALASDALRAGQETELDA